MRIGIGIEMGIEILRIIIYTVTGIILFAASLKDIASKSISKRMIFIMLTVDIVSAAALSICTDAGITWWGILGGICIGLCAIGASMITGGHIGLGDGYVIMAIGILTGFTDCLVIVSIASFIMAVGACILIAIKKGSRNTKIAFIPALFVAYLVVIIGKYNAVI